MKNPSLKNILSLGDIFGVDQEDIFVMIDTFAKISNQFVNKAHLLEIEPLVIDEISNDINISIARAKSNKEIVTLQD